MVSLKTLLLLNSRPHLSWPSERERECERERERRHTPSFEVRFPARLNASLHCHSWWWLPLTADDKQLPRKLFFSQGPRRPEPHPSSWPLPTPPGNPISFPAASCPEWLLRLTPSMEERSRAERACACVCNTGLILCQRIPWQTQTQTPIKAAAASPFFYITNNVPKEETSCFQSFAFATHQLNALQSAKQWARHTHIHTRHIGVDSRLSRSHLFWSVQAKLFLMGQWEYNIRGNYQSLY